MPNASSSAASIGPSSPPSWRRSSAPSPTRSSSRASWPAREGNAFYAEELLAAGLADGPPSGHPARGPRSRGSRP